MALPTRNGHLSLFCDDESFESCERGPVLCSESIDVLREDRALIIHGGGIKFKWNTWQLPSTRGNIRILVLSSGGS